ncbi:MAG: ABC transporter permease [Actinobacteria bacterium]|nr:ABC transporter permease [Actinomycetota bacterium]
MTVDTTHRGAVDTGRPTAPAMIWSYLRYENTAFWRSPIAAFFTIIFPLLFLVLLSSLVGNEEIPDSGGMRVAQFLTPAIAAFAATTASFTSLAVGVVIERDDGQLKRARGTPLAPWMYMVARIGSTVWIALLSVALMVTVGVVFFGVQLVARTAPAAVLTVIVGIGCFAALGLAIVSVAPSQGATQALTNAIILPLAFISDIFAIGPLPTWLERIGWLFPLKHFVNALADTFDPFSTGPQFAWDHLAVMTAWGVAGALVALRFFRWEPGPSGRQRRRGSTARPDEAAPTPEPTTVLRPVEQTGRPAVAALIANQAGYAVRAFRRDTASAFFTVGFPIMLLLLLPVVFGDDELSARGGVPLTQFLSAVLAVFGAATAAYADFSERVARARDRGVLKRIHGTPLPVWAFMAGRVTSSVVVALISLVLTMAVGIVVYGVELVPRALPGLVTSVVVGIACFAALGLALATIAPNARAVPAIANATLLPLSFFSDIFLIGDLPPWMDAVGWIFPLKHFANAVADGVNPTIPGAGFFWDHLAVMAAWGVAGAVVALRFWTWEPRAA